MKIAANFRSSYPKLSAWIEANIPKVKAKPKVWSAFTKYSELKPANALLALTPGHPPEVHCLRTLVETMHFQCKALAATQL